MLKTVPRLNRYIIVKIQFFFNCVHCNDHCFFFFQVCHACLGRPPSTLQHSKLREDVSQDGDQLLSDLSTIQKSYMQENLPLTEFTCDIASFFDPIERKRRHSLTVTQMDDSWSFASRLEEDCLIQMSTMPTLRSVTL
jgi:hypothetical protein